MSGGLNAAVMESKDTISDDTNSSIVNTYITYVII